MSQELTHNRPSHSTYAKNTIHKLINLDKKDISYPLRSGDNIFDVFPNIVNDAVQGKAEKDLQSLWKHVDTLYFQPINPSDINQIESLISQLSTINPDESLLTPQDTDTLQTKSPNADSFILYEDSQQNYESILIEKEDLNHEMDEITKEMNVITTNQHITHVQNVQGLLELKNKLVTDQEKKDTKTHQTTPFLKEFSEEISSPQGNLAIETKYLKDLILKLEDSQTAESIKCIVDCRRLPGTLEDYEFCVIFDEALTEKEAWLSEKQLNKLDALREQGLFKICHIPQKTQRSLNTYNVAGLHLCHQKMIHSGLEITDKPWKNIIKNTLGDRGTDLFNRFYRDQMTSKVKQQGFCHQCRYLFPENSLIRCNYKSSKMGLLTVEPPYENICGSSGHSKAQKIEEQKENLAYYYKWREEDGEYVCDRKYCRNCLKSNYDITPQDVSNEKNWMCPHCQSGCFCSRCVRHEHIKKLVRKYVSLGENLQEILSKSSFQKYIWASKKKSSECWKNPLLLESVDIMKLEAKKKKGRKPNSSLDPALKKKVKNSGGDELVKPQVQSQAKRGRPRKDRSYIPGFEFTQTQEETIPGSKKQFCRTTQGDFDWDFKQLDFENFEDKNSLYKGNMDLFDLDAFPNTSSLFGGEEIFLEDGSNLRVEDLKSEILMDAPLKPQIEKIEIGKKRGRGRPRKSESRAIESSQNVENALNNFLIDPEWRK